MVAVAAPTLNLSDWADARESLQDYRTLTCASLARIRGWNKMRASRALCGMGSTEARRIRVYGTGEDAALNGIWWETIDHHQRHYRWVTLVAGWISSLQSNTELLTESWLRREKGWFNRRGIRHRSPFMTYVPDLLWHVNDWLSVRVEIQLHRINQDWWHRINEEAVDPYPVLVVAPAPTSDYLSQHWMKHRDPARISKVVRYGDDLSLRQWITELGLR